VDVYAPADGCVNYIDDCSSQVGGYSKYEISLAFAQWWGKVVRFEYSFEPGLDPTLCTGAKRRLLSKYIHVAKGDNIKKGQFIAQVFKSRNQSEKLTSIFTSQRSRLKHFFCPNIVDEAITKAFASKNGVEPYGSLPFGAMLVTSRLTVSTCGSFFNSSLTKNCPSADP